MRITITDIQMFRASGTAASQEIFISVKTNWLMCIQVYANGEVYVILCTEGTTNLLPTTYGMHALTLHAN